MIGALFHHLQHQFTRRCRHLCEADRSLARLAVVISVCSGLPAVFAVPAEATIYYVSSSNGTDSNSGLSPESAWQSISHVNDASLAPGDEVRFRRGDSWREELTIDWSGTAEAYITFNDCGRRHEFPQRLHLDGALPVDRGGHL
ncbi:MAG: hypothetical protein KQH59_12035 [Desulfobulbaceae bacterium]|nr:hypothetical protein [Desulfobulbaceae bacterium]